MKSVLTLSFPRAAPGRVPLFDELRGLAILLVLTYHVGGVTGFPNKVHGDLGVDIFLFVSGAALAFSNRADEGAPAFLCRRLLRLLPAYWIVLTAFWIGSERVLGYAPPTNADVISHYLCVHELWGDLYFLHFSDSFWFLSLAVPLYLVFTAMRPWIGRLDIVLGVGLALSFLTACVTFQLNQPALFVHLGLRPTIFFLGIPFGVMVRNGDARVPLSAWLAVGTILSIYGLFVTGLFIGYTAAGFSLVLGYVAARSGAPTAGSRILCRLVAWIGLYSYEIYLVHQPLIRDYNDHFLRLLRHGKAPDAVQTAAGVVVALGLTLGLSIILEKATGWLRTRLLGRLLPGPGRTAAAP